MDPGTLANLYIAVSIISLIASAAAAIAAAWAAPGPGHAFPDPDDFICNQDAPLHGSKRTGTLAD